MEANIWVLLSNASLGGPEDRRGNYYTVGKENSSIYAGYIKMFLIGLVHSTSHWFLDSSSLVYGHIISRICIFFSKESPFHKSRYISIHLWLFIPSKVFFFSFTCFCCRTNPIL